MRRGTGGEGPALAFGHCGGSDSVRELVGCGGVAVLEFADDRPSGRPVVRFCNRPVALVGPEPAAALGSTRRRSPPPGPGARFGDAQRIGDTRLHPTGVGDRREIDENALGLRSIRTHQPRKSEREPRLARSSRPASVRSRTSSRSSMYRADSSPRARPMSAVRGHGNGAIPRSTLASIY